MDKDNRHGGDIGSYVRQRVKKSSHSTKRSVKKIPFDTLKYGHFINNMNI